ncbi:MAG: hypothetical protein GXO85_08625 [Chlorobi bacterium]|nr:hypothetical protein [Chlorobiota bacterium]
MENFPGIVSLFLVCLELVFLINLIIFAEKNKVNKKIFWLIGLLLGYQSFEFVICYFGIESNLVVYLAFVVISFLPPLLLNLVITIRKGSALLGKVIFVPIILLLLYFTFIIPEFVVTRCTVLFAAYDIPLPDLYGFLYYSPVLISIILLTKMIMNYEYKDQKTNLIILNTGMVLTFIPTWLIILLFPSLIEFVESFLCKSAAIMALTLTVYAMRNKLEKKNEQ